MGRRLERHVDWDLTERILASGPIKKQPVTKTKKQPRERAKYRGARRNEARGSVWRGAPRNYLGLPAIGLNRSQHWKPAASYAHAREIGPSTEPVR